MAITCSNCVLGDDIIQKTKIAMVGGLMYICRVLV